MRLVKLSPIATAAMLLAATVPVALPAMPFARPDQIHQDTAGLALPGADRLVRPSDGSEPGANVAYDLRARSEDAALDDDAVAQQPEGGWSAQMVRPCARTGNRMTC